MENIMPNYASVENFGQFNTQSNFDPVQGVENIVSDAYDTVS